MSGGSVELPAGAGSAVFEVERFAWTSDERLEVEGRWFGVRGLRFVRPTLDLEGADGRRRLLAVLDHKPWAADEGQSWVAAFPWEGEPLDFTGAELAVAPSIAVRLDPPAVPGLAPRKASPAAEEPSPVEQERDAALQARDAALRRVEHVQKSAEAAVEERVGPLREHFERERDTARDAVRERDEAHARIAELEAQRDEARRMAREALERAKGLMRERDEAREVATAQRDARAAVARQLEDAHASLARAEASQANLLRERDDARRERDAAVQARDRAPVHHDTLVSDLASALRERDAARLQLKEALAAPAPAPPPPPVAPTVHRQQERQAAWGPRLLALTALVVLIVILWSLLSSVV